MDKAAMLCSLEPAAVALEGKVHDVGNACSATVSGPTCHDEIPRRHVQHASRTSRIWTVDVTDGWQLA